MADSMTKYDLSTLAFPMITVYKSPKDYPGKYVAKVFETLPLPQRTDAVVVYDTYEALKADIWAAGFRTKFPRNKWDDPVIIETYCK